MKVKLNNLLETITINDVISHLESIKAVHGNLPVVTCHWDDDYGVDLFGALDVRCFYKKGAVLLIEPFDECAELPTKVVK